MTSNNGSSLEHSSDGTAERAYPALLSSSPGTASDSTTEYMTQMLAPQDQDTLERDLEQIIEEDWHLGTTPAVAGSGPVPPSFHDSSPNASSSGQHHGDTPVGPGLLNTLAPGSGFIGPVPSCPQTFDMTREVVQRGRLDRPGSGRSSTPTGHELPPSSHRGQGSDLVQHADEAFPRESGIGSQPKAPTDPCDTTRGVRSDHPVVDGFPGTSFYAVRFHAAIVDNFHAIHVASRSPLCTAAATTHAGAYPAFPSARIREVRCGAPGAEPVHGCRSQRRDRPAGRRDCG